MGKHARAFFEEAERLGGLAAKAQLAALARVTSTEAATAADSPEVLRRLQTAMTEVKSSRGGKATAAAPAEGEIVQAAAGGRHGGLSGLEMVGAAGRLSARGSTRYQPDGLPRRR